MLRSCPPVRPSFTSCFSYQCFFLLATSTCSCPFDSHLQTSAVCVCVFLPANVSVRFNSNLIWSFFILVIFCLLYLLFDRRGCFRPDSVSSVTDCVLNGIWLKLMICYSQKSQFHSTCIVRRTYSNYGDRYFAAAGLKLWNSLLAELWQADISFQRFKRLLKTFLFGCWDHGTLWLNVKTAPHKFFLLYLLISQICMLEPFVQCLKLPFQLLHSTPVSVTIGQSWCSDYCSAVAYLSHICQHWHRLSTSCSPHSLIGYCRVASSRGMQDSLGSETTLTHLHRQTTACYTLQTTTTRTISGFLKRSVGFFWRYEYTGEIIELLTYAVWVILTDIVQH